MTLLQPFGPGLYCAEGSTVFFFGVPYATRMAIAQLTDGSLWVWSPIALTEALAAAVAAIGPVRYLVSPNKIHHLFLPEWASRWPEARLYAPPGLRQRQPNLPFEADLDEKTAPPWAEEIDQVIFRGSFLMEEVVFFHRASQTVIVGDLIQRHSEAMLSGWQLLVMRLDDLVGEQGSTPREWRLTFRPRGPVCAARDRVLQWQPQRLLIAHGACAQTGAKEIVTQAFRWI